MILRLNEMKREHNINLAFMECFASCILTYLNITGKDYRKILLDYWNLGYQYKTMLSSKDARQLMLPLRYFYGIEMNFAQGNIDTLVKNIRNGSSAICLCTASKLSFFPRHYLGMESGGFKHSILILGWNQQTKRLLVADPIADYVGEVEVGEVAQAGLLSNNREDLNYFMLEDPTTSYTEPDMEKCLAYSAKRNLTFYLDQGASVMAPRLLGGSEEAKRNAWTEWFISRNGGEKALDRFAADLVASPDWTQQSRDNWVKRNTLTIQSIKRLRKEIWNNFNYLYKFGEKERKNGQRQIDNISSSWQKLSFLLLKYKNAQDPADAICTIVRQIDRLKSTELGFLQWWYQLIGKEDENG